MKNYHRKCIIVDENGVKQIYENRTVSIRWSDAIGVSTFVTEVPLKGGTFAKVGYAVLTDAWNKKIAFADLSYIGGREIIIGGQNEIVVSDISLPETLLLICAEKTGMDILENILQCCRKSSPEQEIDSRNVEKVEERKISGVGIAVIIGKLGAKIAKAVAGAIKTIKPGFLLVSGAAYTVLFSWKVALILMLMLFIHEYGHVFAMKRCGMKVRGIYFIPLLGAAAVTDDSWKSRNDQAFIALMGPLWGFFLILLPVMIAPFVKGKASEFLMVTSAWWALINLFNLLPINPLDGGRVVSAIGYSISGTTGKIFSILAFSVCIVLAFVFEVGIFAILGLVGLMEFLVEMEDGSKVRKLKNAISNKSISAEDITILRKLTRPVFNDKDEARLYDYELGKFRRLLQKSGIVPMTIKKSVAWGFFYILLTAAFSAIIIISGKHPSTLFIRELIK